MCVSHETLLILLFYGLSCMTKACAWHPNYLTEDLVEITDLCD